MRVNAMLAHTYGSFYSFAITVAQQLPQESELLQIITAFPFNVILAMAAVLIIGTVLSFTRKPARPLQPKVDVMSRSVQEAVNEAPQRPQGADGMSRNAQRVEEEMPQHFEGYRDGVVKLYNWFYRFTQRRFEGIADSMTPREFKRAISNRIPSDGASALEYLVTIFEIANYSGSKLTKEAFDKNMRAVEVLKDLIDNESSSVSDHDLNHDESSSMLRNIDENSAHRKQSTTNILS
jgi:hypothetical protein